MLYNVNIDAEPKITINMENIIPICTTNHIYIHIDPIL